MRLLAGTAILWLACCLTPGARAAPLIQATPQATPAQPTPTLATAAPYALTCTCNADLFACASFPFWSAAQACFNQCRVEAGFDIHGLDADGDGVACELEIDGPSPFSPPMMALPPLTPTTTLTAALPLTATPTLTPAPVLTAPASSTTTITALPAYDGAAAPPPPAAADPGRLGPAPYAVLPWAVGVFAVVVVAGTLAWLRRRGPAAPPDGRPPTYPER
jgi:hypothetical protein